MYYIYRHIAPDGRCYVGQTINPDDRWSYDGIKYKKCPKFYEAVEKIGWDNFEHEILQTCTTREEALILETAWIDYYNSAEEGFNIIKGSPNWRHYYEELLEREQALALCCLRKCRKSYRSVVQIDKETNLTLEYYPSLSAAAQETGEYIGTIKACCNGESRPYSKYNWQYAYLELQL